MKKVNVGIIGGGLMGKEAASAFGRWFALTDCPVNAELVAVSDIRQEIIQWYEQVPGIRQLTVDYKELLANKDVDMVYVAVPHHLHQQVYIEVMESGKDLFAEKPFGIGLESARAILSVAIQTNCFVRCSSEMPFLPGPQKVIEEVNSGRIGKIIEINAGFLHSGDLDPFKPINWKRQQSYCGEIGVMGDLGMHVLHIPLRLGWKPLQVHAHLQKIITRRPDGNGGIAECDTWNNATLNTVVLIDEEKVPMRLEMKRMAPGETNTWYIEVLGVNGGVRYSTKDTKTLWTFSYGAEQIWQRQDLGFSGMAFKTITGGIFEPGFPDCFMQMMASCLAEREGMLMGKPGCVTPLEAVESHCIFDAALRSDKNNSVEQVYY